MNALIAIGCDHYKSLAPLAGAEKDAQRLFQILSNPENQYEVSASTLLLSPTAPEIVSALNSTFSLSGDVDTLTFFFAGHGGVKGGSFYLCTNESVPERLSTTAFAITALFQMINEFAPRQVNLIVDACQSGGSSYDLGALIKPETIGVGSASSIAFLGACASDEFASETAEGGVLTNELLRCLSGQVPVQTNLAFLDLVEVGRVVSERIQTATTTQKPIVWGLSLFGRGSLAVNPHFDEHHSGHAFTVPSIPPRSDLGKRIGSCSPLLWEEYRLIKEDPCPKRLITVLEKVLRETRLASEAISVIQGLSSTLSVRASESSELLARSRCLLTCAVSLLPRIHEPEIQNFVRVLFLAILQEDADLRQQISDEISKDPRTMFSSVAVAGDLYFLPLRVTNLLGWIGSSIILRRLLKLAPDGYDADCIALALKLCSLYRAAIVTVSDAQAAPLYVFLTACRLVGENHLASEIIEELFVSFAARKGNVTRPECDGNSTLQYILSLGTSEFRSGEWRPANPSLLLSVLIPFGCHFGCAEGWDLETFDRQTSTFFLPNDWKEFGSIVVEHGCNHDQRIGSGVWTVSEFLKTWNRPILEKLAEVKPRWWNEMASLCMLASLILPDRIPFILEGVH